MAPDAERQAPTAPMGYHRGRPEPMASEPRKLYRLRHMAPMDYKGSVRLWLWRAR